LILRTMTPSPKPNVTRLPPGTFARLPDFKNNNMTQERITPVVTLHPFGHGIAEELAQAAREVASHTESAARLWWAKTDYSVNDAHQFVSSVLVDRRTGQGDAFVVRDAEGKFLGCVSAKNVDWLHGCFQGGYWLVPSARRKGYGQASLKALFAWGRDQNLKRMELLIGVTNTKSLAAAESIGAVREGTMRSRFILNDTRIDVALMALVADEA
jgi:RimJ/RimL family protein N-acetyltransferase